MSADRRQLEVAVKAAWEQDIWLIACMTNGTLDEVDKRSKAFSESLARRAVDAVLRAQDPAVQS